jgi:ABC-type oligopeptide transport system substrate-binding subunit
LLRENVPEWVKEYERAVEEARGALDPAQRQDALGRAQQQLNDNVFAVPLVTTKAVALLKPWVKDPFFHPLLPVYPLYLDMTYIQREE